MKKRRNEIIDAGIEYTLQNRPMCICGDAFFEEMQEMNRNKSFEEGAKWADRTMIEKTCEWLKNNAENFTMDGGLAIECLICTFKKTMEE